MSSACDSPIFLDAELRPNPPLSRAALMCILAAVAVINLGFATLFLLRGAWPVTPFMGADVALLGWAFHASRIAARTWEHVTLTATGLSIVAHPAKGPMQETVLNPYWVRVVLDEAGEMPRTLTLNSHGKAVQIGRFLGPRERFAFAQALRRALGAARSWRPA